MASSCQHHRLMLQQGEKERAREWTEGGSTQEKETGRKWGLREGQNSGGDTRKDLLCRGEREKRARALSELNTLCTGRCARKLSLFFGPQR